MADDNNTEDIPTHPYFVRAEFPFVFIPTTNFTFTNSNDQTTTEFLNEKETNEDEEEIVEDKVDQNEEKNDLRISQPKYSQLLKDLDFSQARMVDVTNLLSDEGGNYLTADDENENPKKISGDEKYGSLSSTNSSVSIDHQLTTDNDLINAANEIQNDLNNLAAIIHEASQIPTEDDDTSRQATQNYDLNENEQEEIPTSDKNLRFNKQEDNISSIPRLNTSTNNHQTEEYPINWENLVNGNNEFIQAPTVFIISQTTPDVHTTPIKEQEPLVSMKEKAKQHLDSSSKPKLHYRSRQLSSSSDGDSVGEHANYRSKQKHSTSQPQLSIDEDLCDLQQVLQNDDRPCRTSSDILISRLSDRTSPNKKKIHHRSSNANDTWMTMLEKLEYEHKERLEKQQKQYEEYMHNLEEKMKQRLDEYLSTTNSLQESKSEILDESIHLRHTHQSAPIDSNTGRYRTLSNNYQYRPLTKDLNNNQHLISDKRQLSGTNLSRSQSREDISNLRTELSTKHAKHISDLKLYYEHEIDELKNQLNNRSKMGHTSSTTRQSIETIERINNENIHLHDQMKDLRHLLKKMEEENHILKRQVEELHNQLNNKEVELKNYHRGIADLEQKLHEAQNIKERQDEKFRHADRQALLFREENEKLTNELKLTRERLLRLEERYRNMDNEIKIHRSPESINQNNNQRITDDLKLNSTMSLNMPTSREYGRFTLITSKYSQSTINTPRDGNLDSGRYTNNGCDDLFHHNTSPRPLGKITDYLNEKPTFSQAYAAPSRPLYSPRKSSPNHPRLEQLPVRDFIDSQMKQSEKLEEKFDELLRRKRDLESRINRIPTRGLTNTDRQLLEVLEREIDRVEQQISSVKLELRKMNILRTH